MRTYQMIDFVPIKVTNLLGIQSYYSRNNSRPECPNQKLVLSELNSALYDINDNAKHHVDSAISTLDDGNSEEVERWMDGAEESLEQMFSKICETRKILQCDDMSSMSKEQLMDLICVAQERLEEDHPTHATFNTILDYGHRGALKEILDKFPFLKTLYLYQAGAGGCKYIRVHQLKHSPGTELTVEWHWRSNVVVFHCNGSSLVFRGNGITFEKDTVGQFKIVTEELKVQFPDWATLDEDGVNMARAFWPKFSYDILMLLNHEQQFLLSIQD